jgi:hypothetical protein
MKRLIKKFFKEFFNLGLSDFKVNLRTNVDTKIAQLNLYHHYKELAVKGEYLPSLKEVGFRCFSQFEEDGLLLYIFALLGTKMKTFIDIGSDDGINSNCTNLVLNCGWTGLFIDGNHTSIAQGKKFYEKHPDSWAYPPKFLNAFINAENINELISSQGFTGEVDFLSIDIDGNDYWVWKALNCISPRVVMIETHIEFGYKSIVVPYDPSWKYPNSIHPNYLGASVPAMIKLFKEKGYRLIGSNNYGFNLIFLREDEGKKYFPEITAEEVLSHPRNAERMKIFEEIKNMDYIYV